MSKAEAEKHSVVCPRSESACKVKLVLESGLFVSETHAVYYSSIFKKSIVDTWCMLPKVSWWGSEVRGAVLGFL